MSSDPWPLLVDDPWGEEDLQRWPDDLDEVSCETCGRRIGDPSGCPACGSDPEVVQDRLLS
jgi:hypothetical protein